MTVILGYSQGQIVIDPATGGRDSPLPEPNPNPGIGSDVDAIPGDPNSEPYGVEVLFEYNGFVFNNWDLRDRYCVTEIDGLHDAVIESKSEPIPNGDGVTPYPSRYRQRTLVFRGRIEATTPLKMRSMAMAMRSAFLDIGYEKPLIFRTHSGDHDIVINCKKTAIDIPEKQINMHAYRDFMVTLEASQPAYLSRLKRSSAYPEAFDDNFDDVSSLTNYDILDLGDPGEPPVMLHLVPMTDLTPDEGLYPH